MKLTGSQKQLLFKAMLDALPSEAELNAVVTFSLDRPLNYIGGANLQDTILRTIEWARAQDKIAALLMGVRDAAPNNRLVREAVEILNLDEGAAGFEKTLFAAVEIADPEEWRAKMISSERPVCRIDSDNGVGVGTGFLIGPDLLITNLHVISALDRLGSGIAGSKARFDYHRDAAANTIADGISYPFARKPLLNKNENLDFALLRLAERAGLHPVGGQLSAPKRGYLRPVPHTFSKNEPICIIQHPAADVRKFAYGSTYEAQLGRDHIAYKVNTQPGSSGSPCFTHDWKLVAMHYFGLQSDGFNRGIKLSAIVAATSDQIRAEIESYEELT